MPWHDEGMNVPTPTLLVFSDTVAFPMASTLDHIEPIDDIEHLIPEDAKGTSREAEWRAQLYTFYDVPQFDKLFMRLKLSHCELDQDIAPDNMRLDISVPRQITRSSRVITSRSSSVDTFQLAGVRIGMVITFSVINESHDTVVCLGTWIAQEGCRETLVELFPEGSSQRRGTLRIGSSAVQARNFGLCFEDGLFPMPRGPESSAILEIYSTVCFPSPETVADTLHRLSTAEPINVDRRIFDIGDGQLLKRGTRVLAREAVAMEFIRQNTSIPIPRVYAFFERGGIGHIVMEKMRGTALNAIMGTLSAVDLLEIHRQLCQIMLQLRRIPCQASLGGWPSGPYNNIDFRDPEPAEPFDSIDRFWLWWLQKRRLDPCAPPAALSSNMEYALAHGDLVPKNILVDDGTIVAVLDWETLGTYPDCWEAMIVADQFHTPSGICGELPGWPLNDGETLCGKIGSLLYPFPFL